MKSVKKKAVDGEYIITGIQGFDKLFSNGIPKKHSVLVSGGAGSGKTMFCLQSILSQAKQGKKCLYITFEESVEQLESHMQKFGWDYKKCMASGNLKIMKYSSIDLARRIELVVNQLRKSEILKSGDILDLKKMIIPKGFNPDFIVFDSITAISSAFGEHPYSYRLYIEQLFDFFSKIKSTGFFITETEQVPTVYSRSGVEEFLADSVIVLYYIRKGNIKERAIEVLKSRGENHQEKIVAMQITPKGIAVYPDQEVFSEI